MREQFENMPRVKPILRLVKYSESSDGYDPLDQKSIYEKYADWLNGAWYAFQEQQEKIDAITKQRDSFIKAHHIAMNDVCENKAKIDELQKLRSLDEMAINQLAQANQVWQIKCDELQARIDSLTNINESLVAYKNQLLDEIEEKGDKDEN